MGVAPGLRGAWAVGRGLDPLGHRHGPGSAPRPWLSVRQALEDQFSARLTHGPPLENGFFYDSYLGGAPFVDSMKDKVEKRVLKIASEKQAFERVIVTKEEALELFADNPFKQAPQLALAVHARSRAAQLSIPQPQLCFTDCRTHFAGRTRRDAPRAAADGQG